MIINVLSGKGGVGKSTVSASLTALLAESGQVVAADCDVDTPNLGILFGMGKEDFEMFPVSTSSKATIDQEKCTNCRRCEGICVFSAIDFSEGKPTIDKYACEGCSACQLVCPHGAIELRRVQNGWVGKGSRGNIGVATGLLRIGNAGSGDIVTLVKEKADELQKEINAKHIVLDSAAGIGCPVIASVRGSDYAVAVTEPTPSALSDLSRAIEVLEYFRVPYGIVINKSTLNPEFSEKVEAFAAEKGVEIIAKLPYDLAFVEAAVEMKPVVEHAPQFRPLFEKILGKATSSAKC
jgi:MinD superfamily P-loop ATPase